MTGLVLKLAPKERVLINGAVLENGPRRSRFAIVTPSANILRLKDAIHPEEANTPMGRVCFQLQLILAGNCEAETLRSQVSSQIAGISEILVDPVSQEHLKTARNAMTEGRFYAALKALKPLLPLEKSLLHRAVG